MRLLHSLQHLDWSSSAFPWEVYRQSEWIRNGIPYAAQLLSKLERSSGHAYLAHWRDYEISREVECNDFTAVLKIATEYLHDDNFRGYTLLHWAAKLNKTEVLRKLLDDPACLIDSKCSQGKTALDCAMAAGAKESIEFLRSHPKQQGIDAAEKAKSEAKAKERASLVAEVKAELLAEIAAENARADAEKNASLKQEAEAKARIEAEAKFQAEAAAKAKAEENARLATEKAKAEAEAKARAEEDARLAAEKAKAELVAYARQVIPNDFQCPITTQVMYEPMMAADGESYEKEYIEAWLATRNTSPLTNELLAHKHLTPNKNLKRAIDELLDKYPVLRETEDVYLANSVIQQAIKAVERGDAKELARLMTIHFGLVTENLRKVIALPKPKVESQSSTSSCSEQIEPVEQEVTVIQPVSTPHYLLNLICEKGDVACLEVAIKRMGADFKNIILKQNHNDPDGLLQLLAKRQASAAINILTAALGYTSEDYSRLMRSHLNVDDMRGLWLDYYLKAHQESPEVVLEKMITEVPAQEAVATLRMTSIRLNSSALYSLAGRCMKEGLLTEIQMLVTSGLSLQTVDAKGNSLLHLAAEHNQKALALWLLANGYSEKAVNNEGQRPSQVAAANQHYDLSDSLIRQHQAQKVSFFMQPLQAKLHELEQKLALAQAELNKLKPSKPDASTVAKAPEPEASSSSVVPYLPTPNM